MNLVFLELFVVRDCLKYLDSFLLFSFSSLTLSDKQSVGINLRIFWAQGGKYKIGNFFWASGGKYEIGNFCSNGFLGNGWKI